MATTVSAPLLSRVKSWQLVGLGLSGWCTLYSVAILTWGASSALIGNAQGGCFAAAMGLASFETRRYKKVAATPADPLQWIEGISTAHLNSVIEQVMRERNFVIEPSLAATIGMGLGVRAVNAGRTIVFETGRWKEPVIDLEHVQITELNRAKVYADLAVIVGAGVPSEEAKAFVEAKPLQLLIGPELRAMLDTHKKV